VGTSPTGAFLQVPELRSSAITCGAALAVALVSGAMALPVALSGGVLTPDGIEHLAIASAWIHGSGFVDPVQWHYFLSENVPLPGLAVRAPVISILLAIPLAFGATISTAMLIHLLWSGLVAAAMFLFATRFMRRRAAAAAVLLLVSTPAWRTFLAAAPLNEVSAIAAYPLDLAPAGGVRRTPGGAARCAAATMLAYLTRPTLGALVAAVIAGAVWQAGPRSAIRRAPLWGYVVSFLAALVILHLVAKATTGLAPYASYGVMPQTLVNEANYRYQTEYHGTATFIQNNADAIGARLGLFARKLGATLFLAPVWNFVGWLIPPTLIYAVIRRRDLVLEQRINLVAILGFSAATILTYSYFDGIRYPILTAVPTCLCGMAMLDDGARHLQQRRSHRWSAQLMGTAPLLLVCLVFVAQPLWSSLAETPTSWRHYRALRSGAQPWIDSALPDLCGHLDKDAIIAAPGPWRTLLWCGNASIRVPLDIGAPGVRERFIAERHPGYLAVTPRIARRWDKRGAEGLRKIAEAHGWTVFEVVDAPPESRPWRAPPPLVCLGMGSQCTR
jgi:hypothetical protein